MNSGRKLESRVYEYFTLDVLANKAKCKVEDCNKELSVRLLI